MAENAQMNGIDYQEAPLGSIHKKVAYGAFAGQVCDGYTLGIVGISLHYATTPLGLDSFWLGMCGTASMVGLLLGSLVIGGITDRIGRKALFFGIMAALVLLAVGQFFVTTPLQLVVIRLLLGVAIGADYTVGIALLSEWAPNNKREGLMSQLLMYWTIGYVIAYIVGFFIQYSLSDSLGADAWRWIICTSAIPGLVAVVIRMGSPESPVWLASKQRVEEGLAVVKQYLGDGYVLPKGETQPKSASWFRLFSKELRANTLVGGVFFAAQVLPFYAVSIFLPLVLKDLKVDNPEASGIFYNVFTMLGVLFGMWLVSRISRRAYLLWTFYGAAVLLGIMTVWQGMPGYVALGFLIAISVVLAISIVVEFMYPAELFPTEVRGSGVGFSIAVSRIGAAIGAFIVPLVNEHYGVYTVLGICMVTVIFGGVICQIYAPETSPKFMKK